jgi:hypothetical protein
MYGRFSGVSVRIRSDLQFKTHLRPHTDGTFHRVYQGPTRTARKRQYSVVRIDRHQPVDNANAIVIQGQVSLSCRRARDPSRVRCHLFASTSTHHSPTMPVSTYTNPEREDTQGDDGVHTSRRRAPLPAGQISTLLLLRFCESASVFVVFPFLNEVSTTFCRSRHLTATNWLVLFSSLSLQSSEETKRKWGTMLG